VLSITSRSILALPLLNLLTFLLLFLESLFASVSSHRATSNLPSAMSPLSVPTAFPPSLLFLSSGSGHIPVPRYTFSRSFRGCWQPPSTSYLHNPPLCHTNTRTHFRARTPGCPSEAELIVDCLTLLPFTIPPSNLSVASGDLSYAKAASAA
jgi:hypothetical protein